MTPGRMFAITPLGGASMPSSEPSVVMMPDSPFRALPSEFVKPLVKPPAMGVPPAATMMLTVRVFASQVIVPALSPAPGTRVRMRKLPAAPRSVTTEIVKR